MGRTLTRCALLGATLGVALSLGAVTIHRSFRNGYPAEIIRGRTPNVTSLTIKKPPERPKEWAQRMCVTGVPNLYRVDERLYRSAQPLSMGWTNLVTLGVKTVVNLRDYHSDAKAIGDLPLQIRRIEMFTANPKVSQVREFLKILDDTNAVPVLVHCQHGADRTGTMCALYRILRQGWTPDAAIAEMKDGGYGYHAVWANLPGFIRKAADELAE